MARMITVTIVELYDNPFLSDVLERVAKAGFTPDQCWIEAESEGYRNVSVMLYGHRPETEEEETARRFKADNEAKAREAAERAAYEQLKLKFEGSGQ